MNEDAKMQERNAERLAFEHAVKLIANLRQQNRMLRAYLMASLMLLAAAAWWIVMRW